MEDHLKKAIDSAKKETNQIDETAIDREIQNFLALEGDESDDDAIEMMLERNFDEPTEEMLQDNETLLAAITTRLESTHGIQVAYDVKGINCAAHTLQLAIKDCLAATLSSIQNLVTLCQKVAIFLRIRSTMYELNRLHIQFKKPRLDVKTRWGSLFLMVTIILF